MPGAQLEVWVERRGEVTVAALCGHLDALRAAGASAQLEGAIGAECPRVVVDLSGVKWVDSAGVGVLITLYRRARARRGDIKVAGLRGQPAEVFRLLRLDHAFELVDTVQSAIDAWDERAE